MRKSGADIEVDELDVLLVPFFWLLHITLLCVVTEFNLAAFLKMEKNAILREKIDKNSCDQHPFVNPFESLWGVQPEMGYDICPPGFPVGLFSTVIHLSTLSWVRIWGFHLSHSPGW